MEKLGVDKIKEVLAFPMALYVAYDRANADGKISFDDIPHAITPATKLLPMINAIKGVIPQLKDLDSAETKEVHDWVKAEFDIADDQVEAKIESGVGLALEVAKFVGAIV